ncbi:MAG: sensor histidine kinase [Elainellaceae cyanobacterium]
MFQATRRRLALWYTGVTAVLLLLFATGFYLYVRHTLVERVDDTLNHVIEVVQRSLVIEPETGPSPVPETGRQSPRLHINIDASFRDKAQSVEDDRIDLEWFGPTGRLEWSTLAQPLDVPIHINPDGETVHITDDLLLRQITQRIQVGRQVLGYLRVSHPWFEVTKPIQQLTVDLALGTALMVGVVAGVGWLLSGLAMQPIRRSYHQLKQFTADASHELRNPIAVIQTNVQVALADPDPDPQQQQAQFQVVERITRRLGRLVDDLLFLARQESGITQRASEPVSLYTLLNDVLDEQQAIAAEQGVTLTLEPGETTPYPTSPLYLVKGDRDQLVRLFTNLIGNGLQYTPAGGELAVRLSAASDTVRVAVCDTGVGIPEADLPHIFDRFYRADRARSSQLAGSAKTGSGLGLAIARAIAEDHRGQIDVDSGGGGTTFTVKLPLSDR